MSSCCVLPGWCRSQSQWLWRLFQEYLEGRALFSPVDLVVERVGHPIGVQVPFLRVIADLVAELFENGLVKTFHLSI